MDFNEAKQKKERGVSVKDVIKQALEEADNIETIVLVACLKNGDVETAYSWESSLEAIGMLEVGKTDILNFMES